jgi:hypothetical protein
MLLIFPAIQKEFTLFDVRKLDGDFILSEQPEFTWQGWIKGDFRAKFDTYIDEHIGFRDILVRLSNQIDFSLYREVHAEGAVVGKEDQLYEYDYIRAYTGLDFIGEKAIDKKIRKLKFLQKHLKEKNNIDLVLVFEPSKSCFYPEYIPDRYHPDKDTITNYKIFVSKAKEYNVNHINFNEYFLSLKGKTKYPLYPRYGIHWSIYGMSFAADSLVKYIEKLRGMDMPEIYIDSLEVEWYARRPDYDVGKTLNLLSRLKEREPLAYPVFRYEENPEKEKPMVLSVADSYYWNIFNTRLPQNLFKNEAFWYFFSKVYPDTYSKPTHVSDLDIKAEIEKQDVVFVMITERFLYKFAWTFIDATYALYAPVPEYDLQESYEAGVRNYSEWFDLVVKRAKKANMSLSDRITAEADYVFKTEKPEIYRARQEIQSLKATVQDDSLLMNKVFDLMEVFYMSMDEALQIEAESLYKESIK